MKREELSKFIYISIATSACLTLVYIFPPLLAASWAVVVPTANHPLSKPIQTRPLLRQIILYLIGYGNNNRSPCFLHCYNPAVEKLLKPDKYKNIIHPVTAGSCDLPEDYLYSSARYYFDGTDSWNMLSHLYE